MNSPNSLVARLYKSKYYTRCDCMLASKGSQSSFVWRSVHEAQLVLTEGCRWMIGDRSHINVFDERWMVDRSIITEADSPHFNLFLRVLDLLEVGSKNCDANLINHLSVPSIEGQVLKTPLFTMVDSDQRLWWPESSGVYLVWSSYKLLMDRVLNTNHLQVDSNWHAIWKLKIPLR